MGTLQTMTRRAAIALVGLSTLVALAAPVAQAGSEPPTCRVRNVTRGAAGPSFAAVVAAASDGDVLQVRGRCLSSRVVIRDDIIIRGAGELPTLDAGGAGRVVRIEAGAVVVLSHLHLTGGSPGGLGFKGGGGIQNRGTITLIDAVVRANVAAYGGGIHNLGTMTIVDSVVRGNVVPGEGEAGGIDNAGTLTLVRSAVRGNRSEWMDGGVTNGSSATLTLIDSVVLHNSSGFGSGGIGNWGGRVTLVDSEVRGNTAGMSQGGIYNDGVLTLLRSTVRGNAASQDGGGIDSRRQGSVRLIRSTVTGNAAGHLGGGIFSGARDTITLVGGSRVTGNTPDDCHGTDAC